jgi:hypothetical protein
VGLLQHFETVQVEGTVVWEVGPALSSYPQQVLLREEKALLEDVLRVESLPGHLQLAVLYQ